jgi:hypothetical protein
MGKTTSAERGGARRVRGDGAPVAELRACEAEAPDGTRLASCVKVYLPPPVGHTGMAFRLVRDRQGHLGLAYAAFGLRHPSSDMRQPAVYQVAHRRLHSGTEN